MVFLEQTQKICQECVVFIEESFKKYEKEETTNIFKYIKQSN